MKSTLKKYLAFIEMLIIDLVCFVGMAFLSTPKRLIGDIIGGVGLVLLTILIFVACKRGNKKKTTFEQVILTLANIMLVIGCLILVADLFLN